MALPINRAKGDTVSSDDINTIATNINTLLTNVATLTSTINSQSAAISDLQTKVNSLNSNIGSTAPTGTATAPSYVKSNMWLSPQQVDNYVTAHTELATIKNQPQAKWLLGGETQSYVSGLANAAAGKTMILCLYAIPNRDNGQYSSGGFSTPDAYVSWLKTVVAGIGTAPAIVIWEPDAMGFCSQLSGQSYTDRMNLINASLAVFAGKTNIDCFPELSTWITGGASNAATMLKQAGIANLDGFSINVSGFESQTSCYSFAEDVVTALSNSQNITGKKYIIDTSRNGNGPLTSAYGAVGQPWLNSGQPWCNPPGRALGALPGSTDSAHPNLLANLWIKSPGETDGSFPTVDQSGYFGESAPAAGTFWLPFARDLLGLPPYSQGTPDASKQFSKLVADFSSAGAFVNASGATVSNGVANVTADTTYASLSTQPVYTLVGSSVAVAVKPAPVASGSSTTKTFVSLEGSIAKTRLQFIIDTNANTISFQSQVNYYDQNAKTMGYDSVQMGYLRFREASGTLYFETSKDLSSWITQQHITTPSWIHAAADQDLSLGAYADIGTSTAKFDQVNISGSMPPFDLADTYHTYAPSGTRTLYVSQSNGSDSNNGAQATPYATIQHASDSAQAGDRIIVGDGTYGYLSVYGKNGTSSKWISFEAAPGTRPIISVADNSGNDGVDIQQSSYVGLYGFEIRGLQTSTNTNPSGVGIFRKSTNIAIWNNDIHDFPGGGVNCFYVASSTYNGTTLPDGGWDLVDVSFNTIHDTSKYSPNNTSGISFYGAIDSTSGATLDGNYGYRAVGNYIYNVICTVPYTPGGYNYVTDGNGISIDSLYVPNTSGPVAYTKRGLLESNIVTGCGGRAVHIYNSINVDDTFGTYVGNLRTNSPAINNGVETDASYDNSVSNNGVVHYGCVIAPLNTPNTVDSVSTYTKCVIAGGTQAVTTGNLDKKSSGVNYLYGSPTKSDTLVLQPLKSFQPVTVDAIASTGKGRNYQALGYHRSGQWAIGALEKS